MCGICGLIGKIEEKEQILKEMMDRIVHRGPDDAGSYINGDAALGFRRLSIIDLANGHQPMFNETGDIVVVFNGEIYNHAEIRQTLIEKGHIFANNSDTECLLHSYEEYGEEMLSHLRGMFGFAIWDENKKSLFMARDFFGIKPLYYAQVDGTLAFGSEIKSILELPGLEKKVNPEALDQYLSYQYSVLPETFFKGIYRLLPGHCLTYANGEINVRKYWDPTLTPEKKQRTAVIEAELRSCLKDSVEAHKISDVEVGSLLSGGVDSSFILAQANVDKTFTVGFSEDNGRYSEMHLAAELSKELNCANYQKTITAQEYWSALPRVAYHMDEPLADPSAVALFFVNQLASQHLKVVMSGEGSDELFGGYNIYHEPFSLRPFRLIPRGIKAKIAKKLERSPKNFRGKNYIIRGCKTLEQRFIGNAHLMDADEKRSVLLPHIPATEPSVLTAPHYQNSRHLDDVSRMQDIDLRFWLPGDILLKADKMSMAHSLEIRVPFLDKEVFGAARKLAIENKVRKKTTKFAFREVAAECLPEASSQRKKLGFPVPIRVWLKQDEYYNLVKTAFQSDTAAEFFSTDALVGLLDAHYNGEKDNSRKIWAVFQFLIWHKVFFEEFAHFRPVCEKAKQAE